MEITAISSQDRAAWPSVVTSITANRAKMYNSVKRLSSGSRLASAADSPSDMAVSERLRSLIGRYESALSNAGNAQSYLEVSDGYLQNMQNTVGRMQELAIAANDGTKSDADRAVLNTEFRQLRDSINDTTSGASPLGMFNGNKLFQGESIGIAVGPETGESMALSGLDLSADSATVIGKDGDGADVTWSQVAATDGSGLDISTQEGAARSLEILSLAGDHLSRMRAVRGSEHERISEMTEGMRSAQLNSVMAESRIRDVDVAKEMINFNKLQAQTLIGQRLLAGRNGRLLGVA